MKCRQPLGEQGPIVTVMDGAKRWRMVRQDLYKSGGLLSVTSRILIVDMLNDKIPVGLLTGLIVLHAEQ